ncbi:hypothetical protein [Roseiconus nitratireducens]|uniref:hypothetical protein n=1 Tax=Roseiconus nitratireducens TaxID=2605748 RepID=UPI001231B04A|nr:hypothetical protein [Roseiconus nitratireducens]
MAAVTLAGCQAGQKAGGFVQVTEDPTAVVADIPAPEQRLASAAYRKPESPHDARATGVPVPGMPKVFQQQIQSARAADRGSSDAGDGTKSASTRAVGTEMRLTDGSSQKPAGDVMTAAKPAGDAIVTASASVPDNSDSSRTDVVQTGLVSASLTDLDPQTSKDASGDVQEAPKTTAAPTAADRTATAKADSEEPAGNVSTSTHPFSLEGALQQSLTDLPSLPEVAPTPGAAAPTRIADAASTDAGGPAVGHVGDLVFDDTTKPNAGSVALTSGTDSDDSAVRPAAHLAEEETAAAKGSDAALAPQPELTEDELYAQLLRRITSADEEESPQERERRLLIASHLMVLAGDPQAATESLEGISETDKQYLQNQLMGLWTLIDPEGHPSSGRRVTEALTKYRAATQFMAAATDSLSLDHLEFCTEIESYGQIKPFEGNRFSAGQQVILYCEVENFAVVEQDGRFQTELHGVYDIYDGSDTKIFSQLLPVDQQQSRNRLRDYFVAYEMYLPKQMPSGSYRLMLTLEDRVSKKYGQATIPFEIK